MPSDYPDWTDVTLIKGQDATGALVTIAVDSSGNIIGVMKGDYAGDLKTIAVDSQGRLQAILTDPEDVFGNPHYIGAAELAARLGSPSTFERRGNVAWFDTFEDNIAKWSGDAVLSSERARSGGLSAKLTAGPDPSDSATMGRDYPLPGDTKIGFECSFSPGDATTVMLWRSSIYDGAHWYRGSLKYDPAGGSLFYESSWGVFHLLISALELYESEQVFHTIKLVVDKATGYYVRCILDSYEVDMSEYDLPVSDSVEIPHLNFEVSVTTTSGSLRSVWVDDVIITLNEPE